MTIVEMYLYSKEKLLQCKWLHSDQEGGFGGEEGAENVNAHNIHTFMSQNNCMYCLGLLNM